MLVGDGGAGELFGGLQGLGVGEPDGGCGVGLGDGELKFGEFGVEGAGRGGAAGENDNSAESDDGQEHQYCGSARMFVDHHGATRYNEGTMSSQMKSAEKGDARGLDGPWLQQ